jgi:hypothetical protein
MGGCVGDGAHHLGSCSLSLSQSLCYRVHARTCPLQLVDLSQSHIHRPTLARARAHTHTHTHTRTHTHTHTHTHNLCTARCAVRCVGGRDCGSGHAPRHVRSRMGARAIYYHRVCASRSLQRCDAGAGVRGCPSLDWAQALLVLSSWGGSVWCERREVGGLVPIPVPVVVLCRSPAHRCQRELIA